jgi:hypothetical protein
MAQPNAIAASNLSNDDNRQTLPVGIIEVIDDPQALERIRTQYRPTGSELNGMDDDALTKALLTGKPGALDVLKLRLRSTDLDSQDRALRVLICYDGDLHLPPDEEVRKRANELLFQPYTQIAAIVTLDITDPGNVANTLRNLIQSDQLLEYNQTVAIGELGETEASRATIQLLGELLKGNKVHPEKEFGSLLSLVGALLDQYASADTAQRSMIVDYLVPPSPARVADTENDGWMLDYFIEAPIPKLLPFFKSRLSNPDFLVRCLLGIAKLEGKAARPLIQKYVASSLAGITIGAIQYAWKGDPQAAFPILKMTYNNIDSDPLGAMLLDDAWEIGGAALTEKLIRSIAERAKVQDVYHRLYRPLDAGNPFQSKANELAQLGLLAKSFSSESIEAIRKDYRKAGNPAYEYKLADHVAVIAQFDLDPGMSPSPYPHLILNTFVPATQGKLDGLECYRTLNESDEEHMTQDVWVIFRGKGYHFVPAYYGYPYDVDALASVMEKVLQDAGMEERFVRFYNGDGSAGYLFAKPEVAEKAMEILEL